jgi:hypothetical protein
MTGVVSGAGGEEALAGEVKLPAAPGSCPVGGARLENEEALVRTAVGRRRCPGRWRRTLRTWVVGVTQPMWAAGKLGGHHSP